MGKLRLRTKIAQFFGIVKDEALEAVTVDKTNLALVATVFAVGFLVGAIIF